MLSTLRKFTSKQNDNTTDTSTPFNSYLTNMKSADAKRCTALLEEAEMFKKVPPQDLQKIVRKMTPRHLQRNEELLKQGAASDRFFLLDSGDIRRTFVDPKDGKIHTVKFAIQAKSINSMRIISGEPVFSTVKLRMPQNAEEK